MNPADHNPIKVVFGGENDYEDSDMYIDECAIGDIAYIQETHRSVDNSKKKRIVFKK